METLTRERGRTMTARFTFAAVVAMLLAMPALASEVGFVEDFALSRDRGETLKQLIPGTPDYYRYQCLHAQNQGRLADADKLLKEWIERHGKTFDAANMELRQSLLKYDQNNKESLEFLTRFLDLRFDHQKQVLDRPGSLPSKLDADLISRGTLTKREMARQNQTLQGFSEAALPWLTQDKQLTASQKRDLLTRLSLPDLPDVVRLVDEELKSKDSQGFGNLPIHQKLLLSQLEELAKLQPGLLENDVFVKTTMQKLAPSAFADIERDYAAHREYLMRLWKFVSPLAPKLSTHKMIVLNRILSLDLTQGKYDKDLFMAYLALPRQGAHMNREFVERNSQSLARLDDNLLGDLVSGPMVTDELLVRAYLSQFFLKEDSFDAYKPYLDVDFLRQVMVETKITSGAADADKWFKLLSPEAYQVLKDRVDIDFAWTNKKFFAPDDAIELSAFIKNVPTLVVKVYQINTINYYRANSREIATDIDLDGMVTADEKVYNFGGAAKAAASAPAAATASAPAGGAVADGGFSPFIRTQRTFKFDQLKGRGVYVIDFIGNGVVSRAVIHRGKLGCTVAIDPDGAGQLLTVLDEQGKKVPDGRVYMGGKEYGPDKDGNILLPFSTTARRDEAIVLAAGDFASRSNIYHYIEDYSLFARFYVPRESLIAGATARVVINPALELSGRRVAIERLMDAKLTITCSDQQGVQTVKEVPNFKLSAEGQTGYSFNVPQNLSNISFRLSGRVQNFSMDRKDEVSAGESYSINEIKKTTTIGQYNLLHVGGQYVVEYVGRIGESLANRPVTISLNHEDFRDPVVVTLQTDAAGCIVLGSLADIRAITVAGQSWQLGSPKGASVRQINAVAGQAIVFPYVSDAPASQLTLSLLEYRGGEFAASWFDKVKVDGGLVSIDGLPAGVYKLTLRGESVEVMINVLPEKRDGMGVAPGRAYELSTPALAIAGVQADKDSVRVQLANSTAGTRVYVMASRYLHNQDSLERLFMPGAGLTESWYALPISYFQAGRELGPEQRYILNRALATKYPGNMLPRPGLLIAPWAIQDAPNPEEMLKAMELPAGLNKMLTGGGGGGGDGRPILAGSALRPGSTNDLDYLGEPAVLLAGVEPDKNGAVAVPLKDLGAHSQVWVMAMDDRQAVWTQTSLDGQKMAVRDLRLGKSLPQDKHYIELRQVTPLAAGQKLEIDPGSQFMLCDSVGKAYRVFQGACSDPKLGEFQFVTYWHTLKDEQKAQLYSKYACHELNFFLSRKDKPFFDKVVVPFIQNKKDKTFMDYYLLDADLSAFTQPWSYARLNTAERVLLSRRVAEKRQGIAQQVKDAYDLVPPDLDRQERLFATALQIGGLDRKSNVGGETAPATPAPPPAPAARAPADQPAGEVAQKAAQDEIRKDMKAVEEEAVADDTDLALADRDEGSVTVHQLQEMKMAQKLEDRAEKVADQQKKAAWDGTMHKKQAELQKSADKLERLAEKTKSVRQLYRKPETTKAYVENNYYKLTIEQQSTDLVVANAFWNDYATWDGKGIFLSANLAEASKNFTEAMIALAVLDLPMQGEAPAEAQGQITPASPTVVYHKSIVPAETAEDKTILISQNYFRADDRYEYVGNQQVDKFIKDEFIIQTAYGCQIVVTNPTSSNQRLEVLLQVPAGSIPLADSRYTRGVSVNLAPFSTHRVEYFFYFPFDGEFSHYGAQVGQTGKVVAWAAGRSMKVVKEPSKKDSTSWFFISQNGTDEQVLEYMKKANLFRLNLDQIAWRMRGKDFYKAALDLLAGRMVYNRTLWSYSLFHNDAAGIKQFLANENNVAAQAGPALKCSLLTIDPVARRAYQLMEFMPLINARANKTGKRWNIGNEKLYAQYTQLMNILCYRPSMDYDDSMSVTYYLLLQDRVQEAMEFFAKADKLSKADEGKRIVPPADWGQSPSGQLQHDYFAAYIAFFGDKPSDARPIAMHYAKYPVERWRDAFGAVIAQLDELEGKVPAGKANSQDVLAGTEATIDFAIAGKEVTVNYRNVAAAKVNYYLMDVELLFSRNPFVRQYAQEFSFVKPNLSQDLKLDAKERSLKFDLPESIRKAGGGVVVEIESGGVRTSKAHFMNSLSVQLMENYGQLRVIGSADGKPLAKAYVKVYARLGNGKVEFFKDGYTDHRGRFDYASISAAHAAVDQFAILVMSESDGCVILEAKPPKE